MVCLAEVGVVGGGGRSSGKGGKVKVRRSAPYFVALVLVRYGRGGIQYWGWGGWGRGYDDNIGIGDDREGVFC